MHALQQRRYSWNSAEGSGAVERRRRRAPATKPTPHESLSFSGLKRPWASGMAECLLTTCREAAAGSKAGHDEGDVRVQGSLPGWRVSERALPFAPL